MTADHGKSTGVPCWNAKRVEWYEDVGTEVGLETAEAWCQDADDPQRNPFGVDDAVEDARVRAKGSGPERVPDDGDPGTRLEQRCFLGQEQAAQDRLDAEHIEAVARDHRQVARTACSPARTETTAAPL